MTSSNKNNNQPQQQEPNKFQHFIPAFTKRKEIFDKAPSLRNGIKFPYIKEPFEIAYEKFISEVVNPKNKKFYPKTDEDNRPITMPNNDPNCKRVLIRLVRHRLVEGSEKLTSFSQIIGFDVHGNKKTFTCDSPEKWTRPIFNTIKEYSTKQKQIISYSSGPTGSEEVYDMPFTAENVDKLMELVYDPKNPEFTPNSRSNQRVTLLLKDHQQNAGMVKEVFWSSIEESLRVFKEMDFNSLWHQFYLPKAIREQMAMDRVGVVDNSDNDKSNNNNGSTRSGPTVNNNSAYK